MKSLMARLLIVFGVAALLSVGIAGVSPAAASSLWTKQSGTSANDTANGVAVDGSGYVYAAGSTTGGMDGNTNAGNADLVVVKYDSNGVKQWTRQLGTTSNDVATCAAVDGDGNIYAAGYTGGGLDGNTNAGGNDVFVVKYDSSGAKQWTRQMGTPGNDSVFAIAVNAAGDAYVAGEVTGALEGNEDAGICDLFLVKYDSSGVKQWTRQMGTNTCDQATGVALDGSGSVYVAGWTNGGLDGNTSAGNADLVVVKFDASGNKQWTRQMGTGGDDFVSGAALDASDNLYVSGWTNDSLEGSTNAGGYDLFAVKYGPSGVLQWARQMGTVLDDYATGVSSDAFGNAYVSGYTNGSLDGNLNTGNNDLFVVKFDASGVSQKTWQMGTVQDDWAKAVVVDENLNVFVTGHTMGGLDGNTSLGGLDLFLMKLTASVTIAPSTVSATIGRPVTFTASVGGGGSYEYSFWLYGPGTGNIWVQKTSFSTSNTWTWTPSASDRGSNWASVWVRNAGASDGWALSTECALSVVPPPSSVSLSESPSQSVYYTGRAVNFTTWAAGGSGSYEYCFLLVDPANNWSTKHCYSTSNTWTWTPSSSEAGTNYVVVYARNAGSSDLYDGPYAYCAMTVSAPAPPTSATLAASSASVYTGTMGTFTASASGGTGPYEYKFWLYGPGTGNIYVQKTEYTSSNTWYWTPSSSDAGTNYVMAYVRSTGSSSAAETSAWCAVMVKAPTPPTSAMIKASASIIYSGNQVKFKALATGGTGPYEYCFMLVDPAGTWSTKQAYSTSNIWTWTPPSLNIGTNYVVVYARNAGSTALYEGPYAYCTVTVR